IRPSLSTPLPRAIEIAEQLLAPFRRMPGVGQVLPVGAVRRGEDLITEVEVLIVAADCASILAKVEDEEPGVMIHCAHPDSAGTALLHATGTAEHVARLVEVAERRGLSLERNGLFASDGRLMAARSEDEIYAALDLPWIPPEIRYGTDEIDAAVARTLPRL